MIRPKEKKERALGTKLFLRGERCNSPKCAITRRPYSPGIHGKKRKRMKSEFGQQLAEKQKIKLSYGLKEAQLRRIFNEALKKAAATGETVINVLEKRLNNVVFRLGFAPSRSAARQLISHGHFVVNGRKVNIPSYAVRIGDVISVNPNSMETLSIKELEDSIKKYEPPVWLQLDREKLEGKMVAMPQDAEVPFDINLVVDYYSK